MLIVRFRIGVSEEHIETVMSNFTNKFGIEMTRVYSGGKPIYSNIKEPIVYMECYAPYARLDMVKDYLNNRFSDVAVLEYM